MSQSSGIERRAGVRADRVVAIKHRPFTSSNNKAAADWSLSMTKNMSHSGLLFLSQVSYRKGDILELSVIMSGLIDIFKGAAEVVRVVELGDTSFDIAVRYIDPKDRVRRAKSHVKQ